LVLVANITVLLATEIPRVHEDPRPVFVPHCLAHNTAAQEDLGYNPTWDVEQGLQRCLESFTGHKAHSAALRRAG
jgi:nucleoside-diphosphate-sugar epimerase